MSKKQPKITFIGTPEPAWKVLREFREQMEQKATQTGRKVVGDSIVLNALRITLEHPGTGERETFSLPLPSDFKR